MEVTTGCNLRCAGCQRTIGMAAGTWHNGHMKEDRFRAILANAPPADVIILQGIGEPTLHPLLPAFVALASQSGKFNAVSFNTNALVRDPAYYQDLRRHGLNHLSISVDSLSPSTAEVTRSGTDCAALEKAIGSLLCLFGTGITFSIVLSRLNAPELPDLVQRLYALGARVIEIQPLIAYGPSGRDLCLDRDELVRIGQTIAARPLPGLSVLFAAAMKPNGTRCRRPLHAAYVTLDGCLTPCCTTNDAGQFGGANLADASFAALWLHDGVVAWMQRYLDRQPDICRGCAFNPGDTVEPVQPGEAEVLVRDGKLEQAEAVCRAALSTNANAAALHGLGLVRFQRGDLAGAAHYLRVAYDLAHEPRHGHNLAICLCATGDVQGAIDIERAVITADPSYVPAQINLADMLAGAGHSDEAGTVLASLARRAVGADNEAVATDTARRLMALPDNDAALLNLALFLRFAGWEAISDELARCVLRREPDDLAGRFILAMGRLAIVAASEADVASRRAAYTTALAELEAATADAAPHRLARAAPYTGDAKPFLLAYQGECDRDLQQSYGRIVTRIASAAHPPPSLAPRRSAAPLRIGFASAYFHLHSVSKLFAGWMCQLDPARFAVFGYQLGSARDAMSDSLSAACTRFIRADLPDMAWRDRILADRLDVLIYPEIGMHPLPVRLACARLAPVQCVAWGHPVTTGLPDIDYFLSSDLMEPADGDAHYTERLVRLPNLSIYYEPLPDRGGVMSRTAIGVPSNAVLYLCCQSIFKYQPRYDYVFPRIAARVPNARFVFIRYREMPTQEFTARLSRCFAEAGLDARHHITLIPPVPHEDFPALLRASDVYLDSIGWSGGNTTLEALACDLPVVTTPTSLMRGRHSTAILRHIGLGDSVAASIPEYIDFAVALAEPKARSPLSHAVRAAKPGLYRDIVPIEALAEFLIKAVA
ncbi:MAG TPA: radical SAM protein [Acetobacteraceae bacterium]|nr:radical SAM protein [Acetobacteraceae bacterium]